MPTQKERAAMARDEMRSTTRQPVVTPFFVPGVPAGADADRAYDDLRARAEQRTGCVTRNPRIYALHARRDGADSQTRVGESDPCTGETVRAIFATRDGYTVIWESGHAEVPKRQTYEAIAFQS